MKEFFLFCSGADRGILRECPTDVTKYVGIGATIFMTALLASLSGGYALFTVFGSLVPAIGFGVLWGCLIFNLDRVIVSGMRKQSRFRLDLLYVLPRVGVAVLLGIVISKPLELKLFDKEIRAEIARVNIEKYVETVNKVDSGFGRVKTLQEQNDMLEQEITAKERELQEAFKAEMEEVEGRGGTGKPGRGPVYDEKLERRQKVEQALAAVKTRNQRQIDANDREIAALLRQRNVQIDVTSKAQAAADGFLSRLGALGRLQASSSAMRLASLFIMLLFIAVETAPILVKLLSTLSTYRPYDQKLEDREFQVVAGSLPLRRALENKMNRLAEKEIAEFDGEMRTEMEVHSDKNRQRLENELKNNERLMQRIAEAQVEIAERLVEEWKKRELENVEQNLSHFIAS